MVSPSRRLSEAHCSAASGLMSETLLKSAQCVDRQARTADELEDVAFSAADTFRFIGDLCGDFHRNRQESVHVSMQEITGIHAEPGDRDRDVDVADQRVAVRHDEAGAEILKTAECPD